MTAIDPMQGGRKKAEEEAGLKGHRFSQRSWKVNGDGSHEARCSQPGCRAVIKLVIGAYDRQVRKSGTGFSTGCPIRK